MVAVALYDFEPLVVDGQIDFGRADVRAPVRELAPYQVAQRVCPIQKPGFEDLLMQPGSVEAQVQMPSG